MNRIELSEEERSLLKGYVKTTSLVLIRYKCQAILMRSKGMKLADIGDIVSRDENTVGKWVADWWERRMGSIFTGHEGNQNAGKLTQEQRQEIKEVLQSMPSEYALPREFWDVPSLRKYVEARFGVVYESNQSYHFLLKFVAQARGTDCCESEPRAGEPELHRISGSEVICLPHVRDIMAESGGSVESI